MNDIKKQIVEVSKWLYEKGMVTAYEGNLSIKYGDRVYITPSAVCKGFLDENMIVVVDLEGNPIEKSEYKPSSETKIHLYIYRERDDVASVIHSHAPHSTAYAIANKPIATKAYPEMMAVFGQVPLINYGTPSTDEIYAGLKDYIDEYNVYLLANHGIVSVGKDIRQAYFRMESIENIAKTLLLAKLAGGEVDLPQNKIDEIEVMRENYWKKL